MLRQRILGVCVPVLMLVTTTRPLVPQAVRDGRFLFEQETFGGNGRTCLTCHARDTGTVSPVEAQRRFAMNRKDPLFAHDGSDDGKGNGVGRMLTEATVLVTLPLPPNVSLADDPNARTVTVRRGVPTTLNTPALDRVLMWDGREPDLVTQAQNAVRNHAQVNGPISKADLEAIARFELSDSFFSSPAIRDYARGGPAPTLPVGTTDSEKRGRIFFEDRIDPKNPKVGSCALCHSGPMLDTSNRFFPLGAGIRIISDGVSELNVAKNPVRRFVFRNPDGSQTTIDSPDPGLALITGKVADANAFKTTPLWGVARTAPYFHDNSARTLDDVGVHYAKLFAQVDPRVVLTPQDIADMTAYMKLLQ